MEAEAIDSRTGERVIAMIDSRKGKKVSIGAGMTKMGHAKQVVKIWVKDFVTRVDKAQGRK
ncbi:MAG: DUF3313 family protein [Planctomycetota bacterium]|jgi:hypothetical protein